MHKSRLIPMLVLALLLLLTACTASRTPPAVQEQADVALTVSVQPAATASTLETEPPAPATDAPLATAVPVPEEDTPFEVGEATVPDLASTWQITPFKVGHAVVDEPDPGWEYIVIYYGIENQSDRVDYYLPAGYGPRWLEDIMRDWDWSDELPPSDPALIHSYITTNEGYQYEPEAPSLWREMALIEGDETRFLVDVEPEWNEPGYAPSFYYLPPVPPGFRLFGSILFKVAGNTTGRTWIIPGVGEVRLDNIGQPLSFPFDEPPGYIKQIGDWFELEDGNRVSVLQFERESDGSAFIVLQFDNATGQDFNPSRLQLHLISEGGWLIPQRNYFACVPLLAECPYKPPKVGPGQQLAHPLPWQIPPQVGDLYLQIIHNESMSEEGHYNGGEWAVFRLPASSGE